MTKRLSVIFSEIPPCDTFSDIACDHGYIAFSMLKSGKCKKAFVSDVSEKSLKKAEKLLAEFIKLGKAQSFVSDGFDNVPVSDVALIAGIGGRLIIDILERAERDGKLPETLILQPMKHCDKVRRAAVDTGYKIVRDFTVTEGGQFYDIIVLRRGKDKLTAEEIEFGRTNILERPAAFRAKMQAEINKLLSYVERENIRPATRDKMLKKAEKLKKYV